LNYQLILLYDRPLRNIEGDSRSERCGHDLLAEDLESISPVVGLFQRYEPANETCHSQCAAIGQEDSLRIGQVNESTRREHRGSREHDD
jgi:hypothetical protein